jgi:YggT family protein
VVFNQALQFVLTTVIGLFVFAALLRFYMQLLRAPFRNPLSEFVIALTDFAVRPLRRMIPGLYGIDLSSFFMALLLQIVLRFLVLGLAGESVLTGGPQVVPAVMFLALVDLLRYSLYLLIAAVFIQAILSWVSPYNPMSGVLDNLTRPFLRPVRRVLPTIGNVDLSPLVVFIVCQLVLMLPLQWLESVALKMI